MKGENPDIDHIVELMVGDDPRFDEKTKQSMVDGIRRDIRRLEEVRAKWDPDELAAFDAERVSKLRAALRLDRPR